MSSGTIKTTVELFAGIGGFRLAAARINRFLDDVQLLYNQNRGARMGYTVFGIDGIAPTLTAATSRHYERYKVGDRYRRLTNVEYARLQGFPDDHCSVVSIYNQYALYGNAVPPVFASWVLDKILQDRVTSLESAKEQQLYLFQEPMNYADQSRITKTLLVYQTKMNGDGCLSAL